MKRIVVATLAAGAVAAAGCGGIHTRTVTHIQHGDAGRHNTPEAEDHSSHKDGHRDAGNLSDHLSR